MSDVKQQENDNPIVVVGAGLTGCCIALLLTKIFKTRPIIVFDSRDDYRKELERINAASVSKNDKDNKYGSFGQFDNAATRSINLALSYRGVAALKECDLYNEILSKKLLILMKGRYIHTDNPNVNSIQPYGQDHQGIHSISRLTLNCLFIETLSEISNIQLKFQCKVTKVDQNGNVLYNDILKKTSNNLVSSPLFVLGCDGAFSSTRASLQRLGRYNFKINYVNHGYKELTVFPTNDNQFKMLSNYLHIWPKHEFMLIGLPNPDKTFTCTLFAPWDILETLKDDQSIKTFFEKHFPSFIPLCPDYIQQCLMNPSSALAHINLSKWNYQNKLLLLGDAAHAIVPFYGQGMNAGFEDCLILYELFQKYANNINDDVICNIFNEFSKNRQPSTDALSELSLQNYVEMRSLTAKKWFVYKKKFEKNLNYFAPNIWKPIYSMVSFSRIPYNDATERAKKQDKYLSYAVSSTIAVSIASLAFTGYKYDWYSKIKKAKWVNKLFQ